MEEEHRISETKGGEADEEHKQDHHFFFFTFMNCK